MLEQKCRIGPEILLTNALYPRSADVKEKLISPTNAKQTDTGAGVVLLTGVIIREMYLWVAAQWLLSICW
jgi:hypothetical protein